MTAPIILGLRTEGRRLLARRFKKHQQLDTESFEWVGVLGPGLHELFASSACGLVANMPPGTRSVSILVPRMEPPSNGSRFDGTASSFICSSSVFRSLMRLEPRAGTELTFALLHAIMNGKISADRLLVRQLPLETRITPAIKHQAISLIMAHRGRVRHLATALSYIEKAAHPGLSVRVGLDVDDLDSYRKLFFRNSSVEFFTASTAPVGPYVIRQLLANRCRSPLIVFHDSDDISCFDRFTVLAREMASTDCDLLGCHELRVDELSKEVAILRFPVDVSDSLRVNPSHVLWHPSSMVRRSAFFKAGGFSTDRVIANDTQFLLRAFFNIRIRNVDGFHYIRRKHKGALTVAAATCLEHPLRVQLNRLWNKDFQAVQLGKMTLAQSSLRPIAADVKHRLIRVPGPGTKHA